MTHRLSSAARGGWLRLFVPLFASLCCAAGCGSPGGEDGDAGGPDAGPTCELQACPWGNGCEGDACRIRPTLSIELEAYEDQYARHRNGIAMTGHMPNGNPNYQRPVHNQSGPCTLYLRTTPVPQTFDPACLDAGQVDVTLSHESSVRTLGPDCTGGAFDYHPLPNRGIPEVPTLTVSSAGGADVGAFEGTVEFPVTALGALETDNWHRYYTVRWTPRGHGEMTIYFDNDPYYMECVVDEGDGQLEVPTELLTHTGGQGLVGDMRTTRRKIQTASGEVVEILIKRRRDRTLWF